MADESRGQERRSPVPMVFVEEPTSPGSAVSEESGFPAASADKEPGSPVSPLSPEGSTNSNPRVGGFRNRKSKNLTIGTAKPLNDTPAVSKLFYPLKEGESITDFYEFQEEIYCGGSKGKVVGAVKKSDGSEWCVKIRVRTANRAGERNWREIMMQVYGMRASEHVLGITHIYEDDGAFYVVMPKCDGGEFFEFLATEAEVPESECKRIIREILIGVGHLHDNNLLHRDIKPENIMFNLRRNSDATTPKTVKLIDFDTCFGYAPCTPKGRKFVGTPGFIAPEALRGEICPQSDLWSIGVIMYILMTGEMPWTSSMSLEDGVVGSPSACRMHKGLKEELIKWDEEPWPAFPLARDLCQNLMAFDVEDRLQSIKEALAHVWLEEVSPGSPITDIHN